jgi:hypothetical protein
MRISELSPVVAALAIVLLFSPLVASQVQVDVDDPRLKSLDATDANRSVPQQRQQEIPKDYLESSKVSGTTIESNDRGEELHATGSGPGRPKEASSIPLNINKTGKATRYQEDSENVDVNDERYTEAASPETGQQQNVQAKMSHISDSEKKKSERKEESVDTSKTRVSQDNRQEASEKGATDSQQGKSPGGTVSRDTRVKDGASAKPIHGSTIKEESKSAESSGEKATSEEISSGDGKDGPHSKSIPEKHAVKQGANSNATSDGGDTAKGRSSDEVPTITEAEPSGEKATKENTSSGDGKGGPPSKSIPEKHAVNQSANSNATSNGGDTAKERPSGEVPTIKKAEPSIPRSSEAQSENTTSTNDIRHEPEVDKEPTAATEQIQEATVGEAIKPEDVESDIIDLDDDIGSSGNTKANDGEPADGADANPSTDDPTPTSDDAKDTPGEKDPLIESKAAPKGSLADFFNKVNKNKEATDEKEEPQAAASNSFENLAKLAQQTDSVHQESPPPPPKKPAPVEEMEYSGTWGLYLKTERPADLDLLSLVFQDHLNRLAGGSFASKVGEARFPLGMGSDDEENEADVILQREGVARIKKSVNSEFVEGLDDIDKFFEGVDPPDELDVGADGSSIQDVLMGQGSQILFKRITLAFQMIRRAVASTKNTISSTWTSLLTRFRGEDGKFTVKKEDFEDAAKGLWNVCVAAYRLIVKFIDDLLEGDDGSDDLDDFELDFKSKINLRDPALNLDLDQ